MNDGGSAMSKLHRVHESELGRRLRKRRADRGLTIEALARRAKVSSSKISMFETGARIPPDESLARLAQALELDLGELFQLRAAPTILKDIQRARSALDRIEEIVRQPVSVPAHLQGNIENLRNTA